jgi:hypothetical protein
MLASSGQKVRPWWPHRAVGDAALMVVALALVVLAAVVARGTAAGGESWKSLLVSVDRAIDAKDISRAVRTWRDAYGAALGRREWEPMLAVGHAALRIGRASGAMVGFDAKARQCYLTALFRARRQGSSDGALLAAEAFADLGDLEVANQALRVAEELAHRAGDDRQALARVAAIRARIRARSSQTQGMVDPFPLLFADEMTGP